MLTRGPKLSTRERKRKEGREDARPVDCYGGPRGMLGQAGPQERERGEGRPEEEMGRSWKRKGKGKERGLGGFVFFSNL
jgi:hypothetical protein